PPATALIAPPSAPARNRKIACAMVKPAFYHDSSPSLQFEQRSQHFLISQKSTQACATSSPFLTSRPAPYIYGSFLASLPHRRPDSNFPTRVTGGFPDERVSAISRGVFGIRRFV